MSTTLNGHEKPVNKMAALSYAKGVEYVAPVPHNYKSYDVAPETKPFVGPKELDLTGQAISRLKIIGYAGRGRYYKSSMWVVRCVCGNHELRSGKKLRKALNGQSGCKIHVCVKCMSYANKKRHYEFVKLGYNKHKNIDAYLR